MTTTYDDTTYQVNSSGGQMNIREKQKICHRQHENPAVLLPMTSNMIP